MKFLNRILASFFAPVALQIPVMASPPPLSPAHAAALHQQATGQTPSELDVRFLQYLHQAGNQPADLLADMTAQTVAEREIRRQYRQFLGREPTAEEISPRVYRMSHQQLNGEQLAREIRSSEEYRHREAKRLIHVVYRDLLGRDPSPRCLELQTPFLLRENLNEQALRRQVSRSEEYHRRLITQSYRALLGRNPDPSGMATYLNRMQRHGWSIDRVREDIQRSPEFRRRQV